MIIVIRQNKYKGFNIVVYVPAGTILLYALHCTGTTTTVTYMLLVTSTFLFVHAVKRKQVKGGLFILWRVFYYSSFMFYLPGWWFYACFYESTNVNYSHSNLFYKICNNLVLTTNQRHQHTSLPKIIFIYLTPLCIFSRFTFFFTSKYDLVLIPIVHA